MIRSACAWAGLAAVLFAADWRTSPFPLWNDQTVFEILTNSPWAKTRTVHFTWVKREEQPITYRDVPGNQQSPTTQGSPVGGIGAPKPKLPNTADVIFRWASALPVRHAKALYRQRDEKKDPAAVTDLIERKAPGYTLEIFGIPSIVAHKGAGSVEAALGQTTVLKTRSGRVIRADRVEVSLHADTLSALVHFTPEEPLKPGDKEVECTGDAQVFQFKERFKLPAMMYLDHLEL